MSAESSSRATLDSGKGVTDNFIFCRPLAVKKRFAISLWFFYNKKLI